MFIQDFSISAKSILAISQDLFRTNNAFKFILTYRFSQDPLEMFFCKIRGRLGWNNNPNALQFKYALRSLLLKNKIEIPSTANCTPMEDEHVVPYATLPDEEDKQVSTMLVTSTTWRPDILFYISGYIAKKLCKTVKCGECAAALYQLPDEVDPHPQTTSLLACK
jgi:hypothetical protein